MPPAAPCTTFVPNRTDDSSRVARSIRTGSPLDLRPSAQPTWLAHPSSSGAELAGRLRHLPMGHDLRVEFEYCNLGYVLAGQVIEAVTGTDWRAALRERVRDAVLPLDDSTGEVTFRRRPDHDDDTAGG